MDALDKEIERNQRLAAQLLTIMNAKSGSSTWESERVRLRLEKEKAEREAAERAAATAAVRAEQSAEHEKTQQSVGITMPPTEPVYYVDPISGERVPFASSTEPTSRGLMPVVKAPVE